MSNTRLIIADLHLSDNLTVFKKFTTEYATSADELYILGDLFNLYLGDDLISSHYQHVVDVLNELSKSTKIFIMIGNRDFLISHEFAKRANATLITEPYVLDDFVLMHGDSLVSDDVSYQRFKAIIQHPISKYLLNHFPVSMRVALARKIKEKSTQSKTEKSLQIMDVNEESVAKCMQDYPGKDLIHGHTHRKNIHHYDSFNRYVLGDWSATAGNFLQLRDTEITAIDF